MSSGQPQALEDHTLHLADKEYWDLPVFENWVQSNQRRPTFDEVSKTPGGELQETLVVESNVKMNGPADADAGRDLDVQVLGRQYNSKQSFWLRLDSHI